MEEEKYWYCFVFRTQNKYSSCIGSYSTKSINLNRIKESKKYAGLDDDSLMFSCIYLGYMTKTEFIKGDV